MSVVLIALALVGVPPGGPPAPAAAETQAMVEAQETNPFQGHLLDGSGYVLPRGRWQLGFIETKYGIFDWLDVGTSPYPWLLGPLLEGFSGNFSGKLGFRAGRWAASFEGRYLFLNVKQTEEKRSEVAEDRVTASLVPLTAAVSWRPDDTQTYSFATRYLFIFGTADSSQQSREVAEGASTTEALHLIASARWRITEAFGLYARGYFEPWSSELAVDAETRPDEQTRVTMRASVDATEDTGLRWSALVGTHLVFGPVNLRLGLGYGHYFTPALGLVVPVESLYPDFDLYVRL